MNINVSMPTQPRTLNRGAARPIGAPYVRGGPLAADSASYVNGPERFATALVNPVTTAKMKVVPLDEDGIVSLQNMNEQCWLWTLNMGYHPEFPEKMVAATTAQLNTFLAVMHQRALSVLRRNGADDNTTRLSESKIHRLSQNPATEIVKFMSPRYIRQFIQFAGVQYGNRYLDANTGPGLAVATTGRVEARNIVLNDTNEQDELWFTLRREEPGGPLAVVLRAYSRQGGPRMADRAYKDLAGHTAFGAAFGVGFIAHKPNKDARLDRRRLALGLDGTSQEAAAAEATIPPFVVVLKNVGPKQLQV